MQKLLYDDMGNSYRRKNLYLKELYESKTTDKKRYEKLKRNKDKHPYIIELKKYEEEKRKFEENLKRDLAKEHFSANTKLKKLEEELFSAKRRFDFYKNYDELTYDATLEYKSAEVIIKRLPLIIEELKHNLKKLEEFENLKIDPKKVEENKKEYEKFKQGLDEYKKNEDRRLKTRFHEKEISKKAYENGIKENEINRNYALKAKKFQGPEELKKDSIRKYKHRLNRGLKDQEKVLNEELSEVRRRTPIEVEKKHLRNAYASIIIPGLGQLLNGQKQKALLNFLGALFIYLVAIPYALGYGNYQGEGLNGLLSLANGARRVDRSLIFMIEGILAIVLVIFALMIIILSFKDAKDQELREIKGIRTYNFHETKSRLSEKGFPYFVNLPALLLIVFIIMIPIVTAILISFTNMDPHHQSKFQWAGLLNYKTIFAAKGLQGKLFWRILLWTVLWTIGATTLQILLGFILALFTDNDRIKGKRIFRTIFILPWAVPAFITIMFFSIMLARGGFLTEIISGIAGHAVDVKNSTVLTRISLILIQMWCGNAYIFLLATGVLQSIPKDLYEAAEMDGASYFQSLSKITLPLVFFQTAPIIVGQYTFNFNNYSIIDLFNGGGPFNTTEYGNLAGSSDILISYIYKLTMDNSYQAFGAAITVLVSLALIVIAYLGYRNTATFKEKS